MHVHIVWCIYTLKYTCIFTDIHVYMYVFVSAYMHMFVQVHSFECVHLCVCMYVHKPVLRGACAHTLSNMHVCSSRCAFLHVCVHISGCVYTGLCSLRCLNEFVQLQLNYVGIYREVCCGGSSSIYLWLYVFFVVWIVSFWICPLVHTCTFFLPTSMFLHAR